MLPRLAGPAELPDDAPGGVGEACVVEDGRDRVCDQCKQQVVWDDWRTVVGGDVRRGRCGCPGKSYLQTRPRPKATKDNRN